MEPIRQSVLESLKTFLENPPEPPSSCRSCGSALVHYSLYVWTNDETESWTVPVGFCPHCDGLPPVAQPGVA